MPPKIKIRSADKTTLITPVKPLLKHEVVNPNVALNPVSRRRVTATQPASGTANHARHHTSRHTQS